MLDTFLHILVYGFLAFVLFGSMFMATLAYFIRDDDKESPIIIIEIDEE